VSELDDGPSRLIDSALKSHEARLHPKGLPATVIAIDAPHRLADVYLKGEQVVFDDVPYDPELTLKVGEQVIVETQGGRSYFIASKSQPAGGAVASPGYGSRIAELLLTVATFELDFKNIPDNYKHLVLRILTRSTGAVGGTELDFYFNGDNTTTNYDYLYIVAASGAAIPNPTNVIGAGVMEMGTCPGSTAPADAADCTELDIHGYAQTVFQKAAIAQTQQKRANTSGNVVMGIRAGWFRSTTKISRITCRLGTGDFAVGTIATLFGVG
jgi:hypothetical protein